MKTIRSERAFEHEDEGPEQSIEKTEKATGEKRLHRVATVRRQQGVSLRTVARRWGVEVSRVRELEKESTELTLTQLYAWQDVLQVPVSELLVETDQPLSAPVLRRAQLVRLMKTAVTLKKYAKQTSVQLLVRMFIDQLVEIMPELEDVGPWQGGDSCGTQAYEPLVLESPDDLIPAG